MAEGDGFIFNNFKEQVMEGEFDLLNDTLQVALVTGASPNIDTDTQWSDLSGSEESGSGYSAGGETLTSVTVTQDDANDRGVFDAADVTWTGLDVGIPGHAILYDDTHASDLLIAYWELGTTTSNGGDYTLQWGANGIILLT